MTSKPASRRARAMILAPRSCPSKPGLATRMRSGRSLIASNPGGIAILAEGLAEHVGDLAHRDALLHRGEDRRHDVVAALARIADAPRGVARLGAVARLLPRPYAIGLLPLDVGIDLQDRDRALLGHLV